MEIGMGGKELEYWAKNRLRPPPEACPVLLWGAVSLAVHIQCLHTSCTSPAVSSYERRCHVCLVAVTGFQMPLLLFQRELWSLLVPAEENSRPPPGPGEMVSEFYPGFFCRFRPKEYAFPPSPSLQRTSISL